MEYYFETDKSLIMTTIPNYAVSVDIPSFPSSGPQSVSLQSHMWFHCRFIIVCSGDRTSEGRDDFVRYYKNAIDIPSPTIRHLESISSETGVFLVVGVIERDGGTLYCTVVFIDSEKGYVGKHRKLMPTAMERVIWGQGDASTLTVVDKTFGEGVQARITATICWYGVFLLFFF
jgi:hypothetical protein